MAHPGYGGYGGGYPGFPGGYPGAMQQDPLYPDFLALAGADQQLHANRLQEYLTNSKEFSGSYHLSLETCGLVITMLYRNFSGQVGFNEFKGLLILLNQWKGTFKECGPDQSGTLGQLELQPALLSLGYGLDHNNVLDIFREYPTLHRFTFDDFVARCVRLKPLTGFHAI